MTLAEINWGKVAYVAGTVLAAVGVILLIRKLHVAAGVLLAIAKTLVDAAHP